MFIVWGLPGLLLWARLGRHVRQVVADPPEAVPPLPSRIVRQFALLCVMAVAWPWALVRWARLRTWAEERPWLFDAPWLALGDLAP